MYFHSLPTCLILQVRKFSYIGTYWNQPRWCGNYIFRKDMPYVARFNNKASEYLVQDTPSYVLRVNMSSPIMAGFDEENNQGQVCIPGTQHPRRRSTSIEIFELGGQNSFKLRRGSKCAEQQSSLKPIVSIKPGQSWRPKSKLISAFRTTI